MEGIHVGFDRRICTDASSKPLPIATYCLRTFHRLGTNPTGKTALHLPWSDFRASFGAEDAGIQEYSKDDKPEITGNRPCQAARIPFMYAPVFSPVDPLFRRRVRGSWGVFARRMSGKRRVIILTKRQQAKPVFSSRSSFREPRKTKLSLRRTFTRRRRISLFFGLCPKNLPNFFTFHYNL